MLFNAHINSAKIKVGVLKEDADFSISTNKTLG